MSRLSHHLKHYLPWGVAVAVFVYLFHHYPPGQVWEAIQYVKLLPFFSFAIGYFLLIFFVDSWVTRRAIVQFSQPVAVSEVLIARGVTYLIMVLNYPAAQAAFAYYLKRRHQVPILECLGIFLFIVIIDFLWICLLAFIGSFFQDVILGPVDLGHLIRIVAVTAFATFSLWHAFWRRWPARLWEKPSVTRWTALIRRRAIFQIFTKARAADYLQYALMRIPIHFSIIISIFVITATFGAHIPFIRILGNMPLVFFIGTLPIAPGGLGTVNAAMVTFLSPYMTSPIFQSSTVTPQEMMFAITLLWMGANYALKALTGCFFLSRVSKDLFKPTPELPPETVEISVTHLGGNF